MASISWRSQTTNGAAGLKLHMDNKSRETHQHGNEDVNPELTKFNYYIGAKDFDTGLDMLKKRIEEVDKVIPPQRINKDRKTCLTLVVPCPQEIADKGQSDEFFNAMHNLYKQYFGEENVMYTAVHKDEVHDYYDARTGKQRKSLEHSHTLVAAYTPEKGINGKAIFTREHILELNDMANKMCLERFGIRLNTGELSTRDKTEKLKIESQIKDAEHTAKETIKRIDADIQSKNSELESTALKLDKAIESLNSILSIKAEAAVLKGSGKKIVDEKLADDLMKLGGRIQKKLEEIRSSETAMLVEKTEIENRERQIGFRENELSERENRLAKDRKTLDIIITNNVRNKVSELFSGRFTSREKRLEEFCSRIKLGDGRSALDVFKEREEELEKNLLDKTEEFETDKSRE